MRADPNRTIAGAHNPPTLGPGEFFGVNLRRTEHAGLVLSETWYDPEMQVPKHGHEPGYFCLLTAGGYCEQYRRRAVTYRPGSVAFHPPGDIHRGTIGRSGSRLFNIVLSSGWLDRLREHGTLPQDPIDRHGGELVWLATRLLKTFRTGDPAADLTVEGVVLELLGTLVREEAVGQMRIPGWLRAADERLRDDFSTQITVSQIADDLDVSPVRLARAFRRHYQESIGDRLRRFRVEFASRRLHDADVTLSSVALEAGFADQSHFNRVFKRVTGMTPGQYRRLCDPKS